MPIVGDVLADRYRLESVLGVGGMASVFLATDLRLDRQVAVKVLVANLAADPQFAERFNREASAMAGFSHPNVAAVYDVEPGDASTGREPFYVMEYCDGGSLADRLKVRGRMASAELIPIATAVSEGLAELHSHGLIHRDIKPANILFAGDRPKLADFGVAWTEAPRDGDPLTLPGTTLGTLAYLAPELAAGGQPSAASDVYALGVTIFLSLTGQYPQASSIASADAGPGTALPVSAAAPDLGPGFDAAIGRALAADPLARPSPVELAAQLASGLEMWGVARPNPGAVHASDPRQPGLSGVDMDAPTHVALQTPSPAPVQVAPEPSVPPELPVVAERAAPSRSATPVAPPPASRLADYRGPAVIATGLVVLAVLAVLILAGLLGAGGRLPGASASASARSSATQTSAALPSGLDTILKALDRVDAAIEAARGGKDGLSGKDANELAQLASSVRTALGRGDLGAATTAAQALADRADKLTKGLDKRRRESLLAAIHDLQAALSRR
jgi:serine/threonine protein kinase